MLNEIIKTPFSTRQKIDLYGLSSIHRQRASGNSIRQVDIAIQLLFEGNVVLVKDHYEQGKNLLANKSLKSMIEQRFYFEHKRHKNLLMNKMVDGIYNLWLEDKQK